MNLVSAEEIKEHFERWGLKTKPIETLGGKSSIRVLGLKVNSDFSWCRDGKIPEVNESTMTRRDMHRYFRELTAHFTVCGRLRIMCNGLMRVR